MEFDKFVESIASWGQLVISPLSFYAAKIVDPVCYWTFVKGGPPDIDGVERQYDPGGKILVPNGWSRIRHCSIQVQPIHQLVQ